MDIGSFLSELDAMLSRGEGSDAVEAYLRTGLEAAERENDLAAVISVSNELGGFCRVRGEYGKGEAALRRALGCISRLGLDGSPAHATTLLNLATLLTHAGRLPEALSEFDSAAAALDAAGAGRGYEAAALQNNIASLCLRLGDTERGLRHIENALSLLGDNPAYGDERGVSYTTRAQLYLRGGSLYDAEGALNLAKAAFASDPDSSPVHRAAMEQCLAELLTAKKDFGDAAAACGRGIALLEKSAPENPALMLLKGRRARCLKELENEYLG